MNRSSISKQNNGLFVKSFSKQFNRNITKKTNTYCSSYCLMLLTLTLVSLLFILMHSYHQLSADSYQHGIIPLNQMKYLIDHSKESFMNSIGKLTDSSRQFIPTYTTTNVINITTNNISTQIKKRLAYVITITKDGFFQVDIY